MSELIRLKKHKTIPFLNIGGHEDPVWARIGKSTVFDLVLNAQTVVVKLFCNICG